MIEAKKLGRISLNILIATIAILIFFTSSDMSAVFIRLSVISIISFAIILYTNPIQFSSPFVLFMLVLYIYNCGQIWLNLFGVPIIPGNYTITRYSSDLLSQSLLFFILATVSINITYLCKVVPELKNNNKSQYEEQRETKQDRNIYALFFVLLIICILYDIMQTRIARTSGYAAALYSRSNNELLYMCNCALPLVVFWGIRSGLKHKKKFIIIAISAIRYAMTTILVGYRMQAISFVLCLLVLIPGIVKQEEKRKYNILLIIGIIAAAFLSVVAADLRRNSGSLNIWDSYNSLIQELGGTFTDLPIIIRDIDEIGCVYGLSYLCGALYIVPFIGRIIPGLSKYVSLSAILYTRITIYGNSSLGGSMLAEFFYNFKWASIIIAAPVMGIILARICNSLNNTRRNTPFMTAIQAYVFYMILLFARGNIGEITIYIRCAVYFIILHSFLTNTRKQIS
jgi:oligosaccharide repeat unit polymerase